MQKSKLHLFPIIAVLLGSTLFGGSLIEGVVTVSGTNVGVPNAELSIGKSLARTGPDGSYRLETELTGPQSLVIIAEGYFTDAREINLTEGQTLKLDIALLLDLLQSEVQVVTGTRNPVQKRESSVAITTLSAQQIEEKAAPSTAELLSTIPGFYVESSGGEVGGNLFVRGLPADGSYRYVAIMEDGMPVYDSTELFFVNADIFVRVDENVSNIEAIRGGNSALFGSNAPGGVINFISKTGGLTEETSLKLGFGTNGLWRTDFNHNGALNDNWYYSVGGFYRIDDGARDPGFTASQGGQLKFNLTRNLDSGFFRIYGKTLNDRNVFYLPLPFQNGSEDEFVSGFPSDGTLTTPEGNFLRVPTPLGNGQFEMPLEDGQKQKLSSFMAELNLDLNSGWNLQNKLRYMEVKHSWNAILPFDTINDADFAAGFVGEGETYAFSYTNHDEPFTNSTNNLLALSGLWHVEKPMENISNEFQLKKDWEVGGNTHQVQFGTYLSHYTADNLWFWQDILTDVRDNPRFVDLTVFDAQGNAQAITQNGFRRFGSTYANGDGEVDVSAFFGGYQGQFSEQLRVDFGFRIERNEFSQFSEDVSTFDLGDPTTLADNAVSWGLGTFRHTTQTFNEQAFSLGVNWLQSDALAFWARASKGFKMPILDNYLFNSDPLESEELVQLEAGVKFGSQKFALNASAYFLELSNFPSQDARVVDGETVFVTDYVGESETIGLETEFVFRPGKGFAITGSATFQSPEYTSFIEGAGNDFSGNRIRRVPEFFADLTAEYSHNRFRIAANLKSIGDRFANNANSITLPSHEYANISASYKVSKSLTLNAALNNAFDDRGLTEGNPRLDESGGGSGGAFLARPILPRRAHLALAFRF